MREEYYQKFFYVLKKFATGQNYKISYNLFGNHYELRLERKNVIFYVISNNEKKYVSLEDAYRIIREHIIVVLSNKQKYKYMFHSKTKEENIVMEISQEKVYKRLIELFTPYLYDEYIVITNTFLEIDNKVIIECFSDVDVSVRILRNILEALVTCDKCIVEANINFGEWLQESSLNALQDEGYITINKANDRVVEIVLKKKFLNSLKKMMLSFAQEGSKYAYFSC